MRTMFLCAGLEDAEWPSAELHQYKSQNVRRPNVKGNAAPESSLGHGDQKAHVVAHDAVLCHCIHPRDQAQRQALG